MKITISGFQLGVVFVLGIIGFNTVPAAKGKPNIVLLVADDLLDEGAPGDG